MPMRMVITLIWCLTRGGMTPLEWNSTDLHTRRKAGVLPIRPDLLSSSRRLVSLLKERKTKPQTPISFDGSSATLSAGTTWHCQGNLTTNLQALHYFC